MGGLIYPLNNKEYTAEDVEIFNCTRTSGVYSVLDFDYTLSGYSMTIGKGLAWIKNSDFSGKAIAFKEPEELTFEEPHESLERYDVVAIRFDADTQDARLVIIKGEPSASPLLPPRSTFAWKYDLFLYSVLRKPSDYNISSDNITDLREDEAYCGIMRDSVTSGVAPLQEVIVENANLKQGEFVDFDANKYTHLVATVNTNIFKCDVVLSKTGDTIGVGRIGFSGMASMYVGELSSSYSTFFMGAQIDAKTTENYGHHIQQISFSDKPEFVGEDFSGTVSISKIVGVCERPEGYVKVDSLYNAESNNAQSGTAVAKAIEDAVEVASNNAKDLITESVDPHFIGDSERAQSGVAVSEALESKQDLLITGLNIKTINNKSILGGGNLNIDYSGEISAVDKKLMRLAESVDLNTLDGWFYKANVSADGKWQNVNAAMLNTYVSVVPTTPGEKLVISKNATNKNAFFACLTDFKEPVEGESLMLSSDPVLGKVVKPGENEEYTMPSDTRFIVVSVDGTFVKATPSKFVLGGYDYLLSGRANVKALIDNKQDVLASNPQEMFDDIDLNTLAKFPQYNGFISSDGEWNYTNTERYKHIFIPVSGGEKIEIEPGAKVVSIACLSAQPDKNHDPAFSEYDTWKSRIDIIDKWSNTLPADAKYLFVSVVNDWEDCTPKTFVCGGYDYNVTARKNIKETIKKHSQIDTNAKHITRTNKVVCDIGLNTLDEMLQQTGAISSSGKWNLLDNENYKYIVIPVSGGENLVINKGVDNETPTVIACLQERPDVSEDPVFSSDPAWSSRIEVYNETRYTIPDDGKYLLVMVNYGGKDTLPTKFICGGYDYTVRARDNIKNTDIRWCAVGDSITQGYISYTDEATNEAKYILSVNDGWAQKLADEKGWKLTNRAIGGTGYIYHRDGVSDAAWNVAAGIDFTQFDIVTLAYGVNDWKYDCTLGEFDDAFDTPTTIYGGMRKTIETIIANNPLCKIVVITPINCAFGEETTNWGLGYSFDKNGTLEDIFDAIKKVCEYYGIEMVDMTHSSIVNRKNIKKLLLDDVHPTVDTHTVMARELGAKILFN
jgi:lysophospholipase L1-like esterase